VVLEEQRRRRKRKGKERAKESRMDGWTDMGMMSMI